jgi:hypothetical protein
MSYLLHEHSRYTSAIDKYWIFTDKKEAIEAYRNILEPYLEALDVDFYEEDYEALDVKVLHEQLLNNKRRYNNLLD